MTTFINENLTQILNGTYVVPQFFPSGSQFPWEAEPSTDRTFKAPIERPSGRATAVRRNPIRRESFFPRTLVTGATEERLKPSSSKW